MIVIALDHRDGSSPIQYVRATTGTGAHVVNTIKISHTPSEEVYKARDEQLRIRLWEISMAYEALMKIDAGQEVENLDMNTSSRRQERVDVLQQFDGKLDIHRPGKVSFCGHSFGAATVTQLVKSVYYANERPPGAGKPLITPKLDAAILHQINHQSPLLLLDMWGLPLQSPEQAWLWEKPLPSYVAGGPGGDNVLSVLSEGFHNWKDNLNINKHIVAEPSRSRRPSAAPKLTREKGHLLPAWARLRSQSPSKDSGYASNDSRSPARSLTRQASRGSELSPSFPDRLSPDRQGQKATGPYIFYVQKSQHFNHSDFGILFPWLAKRFTKAEEPERILDLNTRAMIQVVREAGIEVAGEEDKEILDSQAGIRRWIFVHVHEEDEAADSAALDEVDRKLSITQSKDGTTVGQMMEAQ
jgi:platelet-activating factor acetylhydrolase